MIVDVLVSARLSISLVDKRLHTELSSHGEVPSTSQEILTLALDLVMSGNTAVQVRIRHVGAYFPCCVLTIAFLASSIRRSSKSARVC